MGDLPASKRRRTLVVLAILLGPIGWTALAIIRYREPIGALFKNAWSALADAARSAFSIPGRTASPAPASPTSSPAASADSSPEPRSSRASAPQPTGASPPSPTSNPVDEHPPRSGSPPPSPARAEAPEYTVAKAMDLDLLDDIEAALNRALAEGTTVSQFQKDLAPLLQRKGWWGQKEVVDPRTGKRVTVQLGNPDLLRAIYRSNIRVARTAGAWERAQRTKGSLPYFLYELGPSRQPRKEHKAWAGTMLPVDDPWWDDHFPPNGWGCKCRVRQVSKREAERRGGPTIRPARKPTEWLDRRTGSVVVVDAGLDPAWASNPGKTGRRFFGFLAHHERLTWQVVEK